MNSLFVRLKIEHKGDGRMHRMSKISFKKRKTTTIYQQLWWVLIYVDDQQKQQNSTFCCGFQAICKVQINPLILWLTLLYIVFHQKPKPLWWQLRCTTIISFHNNAEENKKKLLSYSRLALLFSHASDIMIIIITAVLLAPTGALIVTVVYFSISKVRTQQPLFEI